jgi:hypothetical protein
LAQIGRHPNWANVADEKERAHRMRQAAERSAQDKILIAQAAARDQRPIDPAAVEREVARLKQDGGCRTAYDDTGLRQVVEHSLRVQRLTQGNRSRLEHFSPLARIKAKVTFTRTRDDDGFRVLEILSVPEL